MSTLIKVRGAMSLCWLAKTVLRLRAPFTTHLSSVRYGRTHTGRLAAWRGGTPAGAGRDLDGLSIQDVEDMEDLVSSQGGPKNVLKQEMLSEKERRRKTVVFKILERKHFKQPQEANLLTWDAKEQIRFLLNEYPDEWDVHRVTESFPITKQGVRALIHSKFVPKTLEELAKHDRRVQRNWKALVSGSGEKGGPVATQYQRLLEVGQLQTLNNAAGIDALPRPERLELLDEPADAKRNKQPGLFESIVKDYCESKQVEVQFNLPKRKHSVQLIDLQNENVKLLEGVSRKISKHTTKAKKSQSQLKEKFNNGDIVETEGCSDSQLSVQAEREVEIRDKFAYKDPVIRAESSEETVSVAKTLLDDLEGVPSKPRRGLRWRQQHPAEDKVSVQYDALQMTGTGKIAASPHGHTDTTVPDNSELGHGHSPFMSHHSTMDTPENKDIEADTSRNIDSNDGSYHHKKATKMVSSLRYQAPEGEGDGVPYLYDVKAGYQHPFGKTDPAAAPIKVPHRQSQNVQTIYRKGDAYYDEDGELLYKVP